MLTRGIGWIESIGQDEASIAVARVADVEVVVASACIQGKRIGNCAGAGATYCVGNAGRGFWIVGVEQLVCISDARTC